MLKRIINECRFILKLETNGPLTIKDGRFDKEKFTKPDKDNNVIIRSEKGIKESFPDNIFICRTPIEKIKMVLKHYDSTFKHDPKEKIHVSKFTIEQFIERNYPDLFEYYIPGSSLRGVIRSHAERIVRTIWQDQKNPICCDPFSKKNPNISCSNRFEKDGIDNKSAYQNACVICKLFGCTGTASRINVHDSITSRPGTVGVRDGIAIDRFTGGVYSKANFKNQILEDFIFQSEITIRNFELWQLGLLAYVLRDFENEMITIGFGKSKGFGKVKGTVDSVTLTYFAPEPPKHMQGMAEICKDEIDQYGFISIAMEPIDFAAPTSNLYSHQFVIPVDQSNGGITANGFWKACANVWNGAITRGADDRCKFMTIPELRGNLKNDLSPKALEVNHG